MYDDTMSPTTNPIDLKEIFPQMQQLLVYFVHDVPIGQYFPYLTHFQVYEANPEDLRAFFSLNPQLESVRAPVFSNFVYLAEMYEMLPKLQSLGIDYEEASSVPVIDVIHLKNVKEFTLNLEKLHGDITTNLAESLPLLKFDHLESFKLISYTESKKILFNWIAQQTQLTNLEFEKFDLTNAELLEVVQKSPQLKTLTVSCIDYETIEEIKQFLEEDTNLSTIVIGDKSARPTKFFKVIESSKNWTLESHAIRNFVIYLTCKRVESN